MQTIHDFYPQLYFSMQNGGHDIVDGIHSVNLNTFDCAKYNKGGTSNLLSNFNSEIVEIPTTRHQSQNYRLWCCILTIGIIVISLIIYIVIEFHNT